MNDLETTLNEIANTIHSYDSGEWKSVDNLRLILRNLSTHYYHLTRFNIEYAQDFNTEVYKFKGSNAASVTFADLKVPELRITRKILSATDRVLNSIRSEISTINRES